MAPRNPLGAMTRTYCDRLGIATPGVDELARRSGVKLNHLMFVALLERGAPMTLEKLAVRLRRAGVARPDLETSLLKAWHGQAPIIRDESGRFELDLNSDEVDFLLWKLGLRGKGAPATAPARPAQGTPNDDTPLREEEVRITIADWIPSGLSRFRLAAAVLDTIGGPRTPSELSEWIRERSEHPVEISPDCVQPWYGPLLSWNTEGRLVLDRDAPALRTVRRAIRAISQRRLDEQTRHAVRRQEFEQREAALAAEEERRRRAATRLRRAILRVAPTPTDIRAASLLDVGTRTIRTFLGEDVDGLPAALRAFDLVAGLEIRSTVRTLGLDPNSIRLVDLGPPQKTVTINRRGRTLRITPEMILRSTTGIRRPLRDAQRVREYLARNDETRLARRLESDVKALHALYRYGVLHRAVRLRWGFLDRTLRAPWAEPGDPSLWGVLDEARRNDAAVEIVVGSAPGWSNPWARAQRVRVVGLDAWDIAVADGHGVRRMDRYEIQAVRRVGDAN